MSWFLPIRKQGKNMKKALFILTFCSLSSGVSASNGIGLPTQSEGWVFENGRNYGYSDVPNYACYRIPAIVKLKTGELLAFAEAREFSCSDHDKNIDIVMRKRALNGQWGPISIVADHGGKVTRNPGPVVDDQGTIHLVYNVNYDSQNPDSEAAISEGQILQNNNRYRASVYYIRSSDEGQTWTDFASEPANIDSTVHPYAANTSYEQGLWSWYAITPGHALKLDNGKLFFPANHTEYKHGFTSGETRKYSHALTLDPSTDTFTLNATIGPDTNENIAEQLDNGWVYMNMRNYHRSVGPYRAVSYSKDGGSHWMGTEYNYVPEAGSSNYWRDIGYDPALISPIVQASVLRFTSEKGETGISRLLFSNPAHTQDRKFGTIRVSYDEGKTWSHAYRYNSSKSQYSDLVVNADQSIGMLYEEGGSSHDGIYYIEANLEKITGEQDAYIPAIVTNVYSDGVDPRTTLISSAHQSSIDPQSGDLTISVTFALSSSTDIQTTQFLARKHNAYSNEEGWGVFIEGGKIKFRANDNSRRFGVEADLPSTLGTAKHSITAKFDRSPEDDGSAMMSIYLDGVKMTSNSLYDALEVNTEIATTSPLNIAGSDGLHPLNGLVYGYQVYGYGLDNVTIENYAKSKLKDYDFSDFFDNPENNNFSDFFANE